MKNKTIKYLGIVLLLVAYTIIKADQPHGANWCIGNTTFGQACKDQFDLFRGGWIGTCQPDSIYRQNHWGCDWTTWSPPNL